MRHLEKICHCVINERDNYQLLEMVTLNLFWAKARLEVVISSNEVNPILSFLVFLLYYFTAPNKLWFCLQEKRKNYLGRPPTAPTLPNCTSKRDLLWSISLYPHIAAIASPLSSLSMDSIRGCLLIIFSGSADEAALQMRNKFSVHIAFLYCIAL